MAFLDGAGQSRGAGAADAEAVAFFDRPDEHRDGALCGGVLRPGADRRLIHVVVPPGAVDLLFYRRVAPGTGGGRGDGAARSVALALYSLVATGAGRSLPVTSAPSDLPSVLPKRRPFPWDRPFKAPPLGPQPTRGRGTRGGRGPAPGNYIHSFATLKKCARSHADRAFNIVILGDGFADVEVKMFDQRARALTKRLLKIRPFNRRAVRKRLAVHVVRAVSRHSGIDNCPYPNVCKDTYFDVEGNWDNAGYAGYPGTSSEATIFDAGALIAPPCRIRLYVMLVNTALYGGKADPRKRIAYASIVADDETLANLVAHESAHTFARLGDEYIGCKPVPKHKPYPNLATKGDIAADRVAWKSLAEPEELDHGRFKAHHKCGMELDKITGEPVLKPKSLQRMLGLFWGCMYVDPGPRPKGGCDPWTDRRGARYYRPEARCKMRKLAWPFCRPCRTHIVKVILS
jgi:hypothetical protein